MAFILFISLAETVIEFITYHPYFIVTAIAIAIFLIIGYSYLSSVRILSMRKIDDLSGREFELYLEKLFKGLGWYAKVTPATGDQGADLILMKFGNGIAVQTKHYNRAVQEVVAAKAYYGCKAARVVTNNYFTESEKKLAGSNKVELWDRDRLASEVMRLAEPKVEHRHFCIPQATTQL